MSDEDCSFEVYHGGRFSKNDDGTVFYEGGSVTELVTPPQSLFQTMPVNLYGQRVWYKLPYENLSELKILCQNLDNFSRMCEAARWTKAVEIYMESDDEDDTNGERERNDGVDEEREVEDGIDGHGVSERNDINAARYESEMCEEEARVEQALSTLGDDSEDDDPRRTPPSSDCEGEAVDTSYDRWRRGSGEQKIRQVFESVKEFREAVLEYALLGGYNIKFSRWGSKKSEAKCNIEKCNWRVYCSWEEGISQWMIKSFQEVHTCYKDQRCRILSESVICDMFIHELRNDPDIKPKVMQDRIHDKYDVAPSFDQCRKAKKRALDMIEAEFDEQYSRIKDYRDELLRAVEEELPRIEHRMCARHIYENLRAKFPKRPKMKGLFWAVVESFNKADYEANLKELELYDEEVYKGFLSRNPENCCRAFFETTSTCEDALNNFSESYNKAIEKARAMPVVQSLETMRRQAMLRIKLRRLTTRKHKAKHSLKVGLVIAEEDKQVKYCRSIPGRDRVFEVVERGHSYSVNMRDKTCKCRQWDLTGIPCRHALRVVFDNKKTYNTDDLVSDWYLTSKWQDQYVDSIEPVNGMKFWKRNCEPTMEAAEREPHKGRKKKPAKRMKAINESPTKGKKVTNHGRAMHCTRCGIAGHYASSCRNAGVPVKPRKPRKAKPTKKSKKTKQADVCEDISLVEGAPPSTQPSQNS